MGTLLRRTEISYETGTNWILSYLLGLPKSVKTIVGGITVAKTLYEYDHNGSDATITRRNDIDIATHDTFYNPDKPAYTETICPGPESPTAGDGCINIYHPGYTAGSVYRGNVTKVGRMIDVNATTITETNSDKTDYNYDIAGNLVSASLSCCQLKTITYGQTFAETGYAFPTSETKGTSPQLTSATYNRNTGLVLTSTDENSQVTNYEYETDTLRPKKVIYPNGGYTQTEYSDKLISDPTQLVIGFVRRTTTLEANKTVQSYGYLDGRGAAIRIATQTPDGWSVSATDYDNQGRSKKNYNSFYTSTPNGAIPSSTKYTEVLSYDALGRTTQVRLQDNTTVTTVFNGTTITVTDQAGKQKRQVTDAFGRITRVDEPDQYGNLDVNGNPAQPTTYEYDGNNNLVKVIQAGNGATQERRFKYDSLSRLTHEKQVEAAPTLDDNGVKQQSSGLWTKVLKYDNRSLLMDGTDARGVKTSFGYDGLNRLTTVAYTGETGYQTPNITYTYDEERASFYNKGRLTKVKTAAVGGTQNTPETEQIYDYDKQGQVVKHLQNISGQGYLLEYGYNLAGQLTSEKYPSGKVVSVNYDATGRLSSVSDTQRTYLSGVSFNSQTLPSQMNLGNGTSQTFGFNDRLQMTNQTLSRGSAIVQKYDYGYGQIDSNGNLDTTKNNGQLGRIESYIGNAKQWTQKFSYDSIGRLSEAKEYRGDTNALTYKQKFDFDRFGNLYRKVSSNSTTGQENPLPFAPIEDSDIDKNTNRFTTSTSITYNEAGQVISDNKFRLVSFGYDANGRMVKATKANVPDALSVFDALGNRVATKVNDVWQFVIYDAFGKLIAEYGGLQATGEGGVKYVLQDWQGSVRATISNSGFVNSRTDYQVFGREIQTGVGLRTAQQGFGSGINTRQGYGLTESDEASGLNHTWFRKLENQAGRWTSPDPYNGSANVGSPQSWNRFAYVENQPTNFIDPSGLNLSIICQWWHTVYDGGPRDGQEVPGSVRWLTCTTYDDGRNGGGQTSVDLGGGVSGSTSKNDPNNAKRDRLTTCFNEARATIAALYNSAVNVTRENTNINLRNLSIGLVLAVGLAIGVGLATAGWGAIIGGFAAVATYLLATNTVNNTEINNIRGQREIANIKLKEAFDKCKREAGL